MKIIYRVPKYATINRIDDYQNNETVFNYVMNRLKKSKQEDPVVRELSKFNYNRYRLVRKGWLVAMGVAGAVGGLFFYRYLSELYWNQLKTIE